VLAFSFLSVLLGATIAQYLRVLCVVPIGGVAFFLPIAVGPLCGDSSLHSVASGAAAVVTIQTGYFFGLTIRQLIMDWKNPELTKRGLERALVSKSHH
jgi:hypothetical protein